MPSARADGAGGEFAFADGAARWRLVQRLAIGSQLARRQHLLQGNPSARADGNEDAVPIGLTARYPRLLCGELGSVCRIR